jgi:hypothetical protein
VIGEQKASRKAIGQDLKSVRAQLQLNTLEIQNQGKRIAALPCDHHQRRISQMLHKLTGVEDDTGALHIDSLVQKTRWKTIAKMAAAVVALSGAVAGILAAMI